MQLSQRNHELSAVNERMRQDLQAAVKVQESLLPVQLPRIEGLDFAWLYRPCDQLGGDTLNLYRLDENHLGFYVLDVSGHGVSSALLAVQVSRFLSPLIAAGSLPKRAVTERPERDGESSRGISNLMSQVMKSIALVSAGTRPAVAASPWQWLPSW